MENNKVIEKLENDPFVVDELFEEIFNGLAGVYLRLYYKESERGEYKDKLREAEFLKRFNEIGRLKSSYGLKKWDDKRTAIAEYAPEYRKMIDLELHHYANTI